MLWDQTKDRPLVDAIGADLLRAADYMQKHGWCTCELIAADGRVCVLGAIRQQTGKATIPSDRYFRAAQRLNRYLGGPPNGWNDYTCRSEEEALAALRAAAYCV